MVILQKVVVIAFMTYVSLVLLVVSATNQGVFWRPLKVSHSRLLTGSRRRGSNGIRTTFKQSSIDVTCSMLCHQVEWCNLWCEDPSSSTNCLFFDMYVVIGYQETNMNDALPCSTRNPIDFAVGASIEGDIPHISGPDYVKEGLIDGIYDYGLYDGCYQPADDTDPWFKLDLGSVKLIHQVKILTPPNSYGQYTYGLEVRVGIENAPSGDFRKYTQLGYFPDPTEPGVEFIANRGSPVMARYVSVQRWSDPACSPSQRYLCSFVICHIEVN